MYSIHHVLSVINNSYPVIHMGLLHTYYITDYGVIHLIYAKKNYLKLVTPNGKIRRVEQTTEKYHYPIF